MGTEAYKTILEDIMYQKNKVYTFEKEIIELSTGFELIFKNAFRLSKRGVVLIAQIIGCLFSVPPLVRHLAPGKTEHVENHTLNHISHFQHPPNNLYHR